MPKNLPIIVQDQADSQLIHSQGFQYIRVIGESTIGKVILHKTGNAHGTPEMYTVALLGKLLGELMGKAFTVPQHKSLYIMGDTL